MDTYKKIREHISALSDGALPQHDVELAFAALQTADGRHAWNTYHRIGDALRAQATPELSAGFAERLAARLAAEPDPCRRAPRSGGDGGARRSPSTPGVATAARSSAAMGAISAINAMSAPSQVAAAAAAAAAAVIDGGELADAQAVVSPKPAIVSVS